VATIEYRGLTKVFAGGVKAVDDVNLEVGDGEFLVLVGPSGSGKTTVLRMTAGLEDVTDGAILLGGEDVTDTAAQDRDIAMVFQNYALYPHMTVYDNMGFGLRLHGHRKPEIRRRVEEAAHMLGIDDLLKRKPAHLSGGQRQRVAMGRAIVRDPAAFLMDEPLSNLDAKLRVEMRAYISMLHQRLGTTTLYVTHDQTEAMTMGDRVAVMRDGRVEQVDTPQALYERPANLFVAGFIGSPAMNLVRSRLSFANGDVVAAFGDGALRLPRRLLERHRALGERVGDEVILGVRPEDIEDAAFAGRNGGSSVDVVVSLAEPMGAEVVAHFPIAARPVVHSKYLAELEDDGQASLTARLNPRTQARAGERLRLSVDVERLHFFDAATEQAL
jgi:multiple sugar transport system ATP-binding protein